MQFFRAPLPNDRKQKNYPHFNTNEIKQKKADVQIGRRHQKRSHKNGFQYLDRLFRAKSDTVETLVLTQKRMAEGKMTTGGDHTTVKA